VAATGAEFLLSSFFWLPFDGMKLHPVRDYLTYYYLNIGFFQRLRYRDA
jgi:hypothetical protein